MNQRTPLKRYTPLPRKRLKPRTHKFTVRLRGLALTKLRFDCWMRDGRRCKECGVLTHWEPRFPTDPDAYDMAHIKSRGAGGSDELSNVRTLCHACHMEEHSKGLIA